MKRNSAYLAFVLLAAAGAASAQSSTGWRRVGDPQQAQASPEPVDTSDAYGQPAQAAAGQQVQAQAQPPAAYRPAYGLPPEVTVKPGTYMTVRTNQLLTSDRNQPGDTFTATLMQPLVADGVVVAHRGQTVYGRVAEVEKQHSDRPSRLKLELTGLTLADGTQVPLHSQLVARQGGQTPGGAQAGTVIGTTAVGAAIGAAADWGRGAAIGAGAGAAAGIVGVLLTRNHPTVVYPETALTFNIAGPLAVSTVRAPQAFRFVGPEDYDRPAPQIAERPRETAPRAYYYSPGYYPYSAYPYYPYYWGPSFGVGVYYGGGWGHGRRWR